MGTVRLGVFPSINNKILQDKIANDIASFFINKFPVGFFYHLFIDTQNKNASQYIINSNGEFVKYESGQKILQPNIKFSFEQGSNNIKDTFNGIYNVNMKPGAYSIDTDLTGYKPIYEDCYGSILSVNDYPIRNNVNIKIICQTKADQLAIANILNSNFKAGTYGDIVEVDTLIPLPQLLMEYLRSCLMKPEILNLSKLKENSNKYDEYKKEINKKFMELIYKFSNGAIKPYKSNSTESNYEFVYCYNRKQRVYFKLEEPELDSGNKKGNVYDSFSIDISGYIDYANTISFITSVPSIIRGTKNNWYLKTSNNKDKNLYYSMMKFKEVYRENRFLKFINNDYIHFYLERELLMSVKEESFDLLDEILTEKQFPAHYHVLKALLSLIKTQEEFDELFEVVIYKDRYPITDYEIDKSFHIKVHNCDLQVPYYIDVFLNKNKYNLYLEKMKDYLNKYEINWDESNINTNRGYNNDILWGKYKGQIIYDHNTVQLSPDYIGRDINKIYSSISNNKGSNWNINFENGEALDKNTNAFLPIKTNLYLVPDPSFDYYFLEITKKRYETPELIKDGTMTNFLRDREYYFYNDDGDLEKVDKELNPNPDPSIIYYHYETEYDDIKYIKLEDMSNGFNINKDYYIYDSDNNKFLEIDVYKMLVPNQNFKYYIKKEDTDEFVEVKNISKFDKDLQYFINITDKDYGNIFIKVIEKNE